jgi:peptide deformylase
MFEDLKIICWPDPRLLKKSAPVESFNEELRALAQRMIELMREARGVGLAAPQVGHNIRLFVMNPTAQPGDERIYVNPVLAEPDEEEEGEEGCLSLPGINIKVVRSKIMTLEARDLGGRRVELRDSGYPARIWQHEFDHLNGTLLTDRMGALAKLSNKKTLAELKANYQAAHPHATLAGKGSRM